MPLLQLQSVSKSYREPGSDHVVPVLRDVDLTIDPGESLAIVGPSGCGKSTLLNILGTLDAPDSGSVILDGEAVSQCTAQRLAAIRSQKIGFIFQLHHLMPQCTVLENVLLPTLALKNGSNGSATQRAAQLLFEVGLKDRLSWKPAQLSGGERQRVAVVRALINQPKLILADEPTGALDEKNAEALTTLLLDLQQSTGVSLVMVTHHPAQAARMARVLRMHEGHLLTP
ncbi:MAG TPA: ABC transporter ATP-binding protein [Prosthecobacter sp.]|nr:ABC transporter ATP-binding protein [Prosthecobacter sp.]